MDPSVCEVCGTELLQRLMHTCDARRGELCGPFLERREHWVGNAQHVWLQEHNCVKPEPDRCWIGCGAEPPKGRRPRCCVG